MTTTFNYLALLLIAVFPHMLSSQSVSIEDTARDVAIAFSYGKRFESGLGAHGNLFTAAVLFPRKKRNYLELEARFFYSSTLKPFTPDPAIHDEVREEAYRPEIVFKYDAGLFEWKFLTLYLNPYAYIFYEHVNSGPSKYQYPDPTTKYPSERSEAGTGIGLELRPQFRITNSLGLFTAISYNLWQLSYMSSSYYTLDPSEPENDKISGFETEILDESMNWTLGLVWIF